MQMSFTDHATATAAPLASLPKKRAYSAARKKTTERKPPKPSKYEKDLEEYLVKAKDTFIRIAKNDKNDLGIIKNDLINEQKKLQKIVVKGKEYLDKVDHKVIPMTKEMEKSERTSYTNFRVAKDRVEHKLKVLEEVIEQFKDELDPPVRH